MTRLRGVVALLMLFVSTSAFAQSVKGYVVDPDKRPVSGANVLILQGDTVVGSAVTAKDGQFGPVVVGPGQYEITAAASGLGAAPKAFSISAGAATEVEIALSLRAVQESVVVSAAQVDRASRTTDSVTVIDRGQLQTAQIHSVADALRTVPGFHVVESGGVGALASIFPRGGESDYTLVVIDGVSQNAFGGAFDAGHLDTAALDRVEVVRGPKSALYGSGAIGGVVHLVTRHGGPTRGQFSVEGGGYGLMRSTGSASGGRGPWSWGGSLSRLTNDGDTREFSSIGRKVANDDYERTDASASVGWSDRASRSIRVDVNGGKNIKGFPGPYGSDPAHLYGGLDTISRGTNTSTSIGLSGAFGAVPSGRHTLQLTSLRARSDYTSPYGTSTDENGRITGRYQFDREMKKAGLSAGWEFLREQVDNTYITGTLFQPIPVKRTVSGLFVEGRPSLGNTVRVSVGARIERIARGPLEASSGSHPLLPGDVIWSFNPKVSAAFFINTSAAYSTKIRASAGTGIKPPTGFEIAYTDNPSLKPERSRSFDAGLEQAIGSAFSVDATYFFNRYDDLIVSVGSAIEGASKYKSDNIANAQASGLELGAQWRHTSGLAVHAGYTSLTTEVLGIDQFPDAAPSPYTVGQPLVRRPTHFASAEVTWTDGRGSVFFSISGRGKMSDLEPNYASTVVTNPGFSVSTAGGSVNVGKYVEVFGRVANLFDQSHEEVLGFPAPGRSAFIGVRVAAGK